MLRVFQSASGNERQTRARSFINELPTNTEIVVVANARTSADDFVRSLANQRGATIGLHRFSLAQFAALIARGEMATRGLAPVTAIGAVALAVRCVFEVRKNCGFNM